MSIATALLESVPPIPLSQARVRSGSPQKRNEQNPSHQPALTAVSAALSFLAWRPHGPASFSMTETKSTCPFCGVGCGVVIESQGDQITGMRGDPDHPAR